MISMALGIKSQARIDRISSIHWVSMRHSLPPGHQVCAAGSRQPAKRGFGAAPCGSRETGSARSPPPATSRCYQLPPPAQRAGKHLEAAHGPCAVSEPWGSSPRARGARQPRWGQGQISDQAHNPAGHVIWGLLALLHAVLLRHVGVHVPAGKRGVEVI
mgnify:CR=1 FL=1